MPEGDTVWLTAHRLDAALSGRVLTVAELRVPQLATTDLAGETVPEVVARGKHVLTRFAVRADPAQPSAHGRIVAPRPAPACGRAGIPST